MSQRYNVPSCKNVFDALISISVPIENVVSVLNQSGYGIDVDFQEVPGVLQYESSEVLDIKGGQKVNIPSSGVSKYFTNGSQNIFDVCLMTNGDINKFVLLISENQAVFNSTNSTIEGVLAVNFKDSDVTDSGFKLAIKKAGIDFTTGDKEGLSSGILTQENDYYILQENGFAILY